MLEILATDTRAQKAGKVIFNDKIAFLKSKIAELQKERIFAQSTNVERRASSAPTALKCLCECCTFLESGVDSEPDFDSLLKQKSELLLIEQDISATYAELLDFIARYVNDFSENSPKTILENTKN